jgi:hypothetical protein
MLKSGKFRKITGLWLKLLVWLVILVGVVIIQSGALRSVEVEASINVSATVNEPVIQKVLPASGPVAGNTTVTISGANFSEVIAVTFGGVNAQSFTINSPTSISALTPPGQPGEVKVAVVTADKAAALDNGFTYLAPVSPTATPSPTATTINPATPGLTLTVTPAGNSPTPAVTTPFEGQITGSPQPGSPGPGPSPTASPVIVTGPPASSVSPEPETVTPGSSPTATVTTSPPTGSPALTPGTVEISPAATLTPGPTAPPRPVATATVTPTLTPTLPDPSATVQADPAVSPTPALTPTPTPDSPAISPTATAAVQPSLSPATASVSVSPSSTPATASVSPTVTPVSSVSPSGTPTGSGTLTPGTPGTTEEATGTPEIELSPTATVIVAPTPTLVVAPAPTMALTPAGTASPSPSASVSASPTPVITDPPVITKISPASGPALGGTTVIISGENFSEQSLVTFGGLNPASVTVNSPTQITVVTAPQPAGAVSVVVKTEAGLAPLSNGFSFTAGSVVISQAPTNFNYSGKLTGKVLVLKSFFSVGVSDTTGNGAGWHLVARSTVLSSGKAVIPVANHTIQNVKVVTKSGLPPENKTAFPLTFPTADDTIFSAGANSGTGESIITFETQLIIPPDIPAGNYTLTLNVEVVAGA